MAVPAGQVSYDAAATAAAPDATPEERARAEAFAAAGGPSEVVLPFGVTLLTNAWRDEWLWGLAQTAFSV